MRATMLSLALTASMTAIGGNVARSADDLEAMTAAAASKWKAQREGVVTGRFSIRLYRYASSLYKQKIPAEAFRKLFDGKDASSVEAAIDKIQGLRGEPSIKSFKPYWNVPIEISCEGIKWRNEWKGSPYSVFVFNGNDWIEYQSGIHQTTIIPGRTNRDGFTLDNLCFLPNEPATKEILSSKNKQLQDGKVKVETARRKIIFDHATGFIDLHALSSPSQKRLNETRQASPIRLEAGFMFPRLKVRVDFEGEYVKSFEVLLIDKAELNGIVPSDDFVVSVPEKTTILDTREKPHPHRLVKDAVPDVLSFADAGEVKHIPELELPKRSHNRWLYAMLTLPLVVLIARSLLRRWRARISNG